MENYLNHFLVLRILAYKKLRKSLLSINSKLKCALENVLIVLRSKLPRNCVRTSALGSDRSQFPAHLNLIIGGFKRHWE